MGFPIQRAVLLLHGISLTMSMVGYLCLNLNSFYANLIFHSHIAFWYTGFEKIGQKLLITMAHFYLEFEKSLKPLDDMIYSLESKAKIYPKRKFNHYQIKNPRDKFL